MPQINNFIFSKTPQIFFGSGKFDELPGIIASISENTLLITGSASFHSTQYYTQLLSSLKALNINIFEENLSGEPSPEFIDNTTNKYRSKNIGLVIGIGGGSAIDAGKAVSAMLLSEGSVKQYLEGRETKKHNGKKVFYIAVPTSSGTGSEATKNAVLSEIGTNGFKSSLRHVNFVPDIAILDPRLTLSCPPDITAACGLDTLTQLLESYVSTGASPITDALALSGLQHFKDGFINAFLNGAVDITARENMSYASLLSGITLANAGLGVVHGFASSIGGFFNVPHGAICGTLLAEATKITIETLLKNENQNSLSLSKYAKAGVLLSSRSSTTIKQDCRLLVEALEELMNLTKIPKLSNYSISKSDIDRIVNATSNKSNPALLSKDQLKAILNNRI